MPLNDTMGLHYNAGPYMLVYSRAPTNEHGYEYEADEGILWPQAIEVSTPLPPTAYIPSHVS